jgi:hypothetical protein
VLGALQCKPLPISTQTYTTNNVKYGGQGGSNLKRIVAGNETGLQATEEDLNWLQAMFISGAFSNKTTSHYNFNFLSYYVLLLWCSLSINLIWILVTVRTVQPTERVSNAVGLKCGRTYPGGHTERQ